MNAAHKSKAGSGEEAAKVVSDPGRTKRAKAFRERLGSSDLSRWEIYTSEFIKNEVRSIAKSEGLTSGVAAEALLRLGIDAYKIAGTDSATARASGAKVVRPSARRGKNSSAPTPIDRISRASSTERLSSKPLSSYSSRPESSRQSPSRQKPVASDKAASVVRGFLARATKRGK